MLREAQKLMSHQWREWISGYLLTLFGWVIGVCVIQAILWFGSEAEEIFALGGVAASMVFAVYWGGWMLMNLPFWFSMTVSMGRTRKRFFVAYYLSAFTGALLGLGIILLLTALEERIYGTWQKKGIMVTEVLPYELRYGVLAVILIVALMGLCAALMMKWGKKIFWALWFLWMFLCLGLPQMLRASKETPASVLGVMGKRVIHLAQSLSLMQWMGLGVVAAAVCFVASYRILRRQQVLA